MEYQIPFIPGPTSVPLSIRNAYLTNYGSADLEEDYFQLYSNVQNKLRKLLNTSNQMAIMSGEGMVVLWGALKSTLKPNDRVLVISSGLFGDGFAEMAESLQCQVQLIKGKEGDCPSDDEILNSALNFKPDLITFVLCETPSGILNPISKISQISKQVNALFCVDFVSCGGGIPIFVDEWNIDLGLLGTQKCLSCLPDLGICSVSSKAWKRIEEVNYKGYDALFPFRDALQNKYFPYTPNWHALAALNTSLDMLFSEGLEAVFKRHNDVAKYTREEVKKIGLKLYPVREELNSPTVTAVYLPDNMKFEELDKELRKRGIVIGGTFGDLAGKIFRIGHMGSQAKMEYAEKLISALKEVIRKE
ncbi:alanine--glyoxylate aminotransferase family protein [Histomonas meleagridis]|uniref:alanine--glyoxylate aminotransferase family protein n=1 Tax=Histomonas meleagridis TaxID=135588 RepID=UPI00355961AC|nr:alanine--glyoxylate aminotransferase family protein [Histomonas meleagridis]KAH0801381.1 alanine--glyoxylate aminotransferase family protein [Histomonas meleagridis]